MREKNMIVKGHFFDVSLAASVEWYILFSKRDVTSKTMLPGRCRHCTMAAI